MFINAFIVLRHVTELCLGLRLHTCDRNTAKRLLDILFMNFTMIYVTGEWLVVVWKIRSHPYRYEIVQLTVK